MKKLIFVVVLIALATLGSLDAARARAAETRIPGRPATFNDFRLRAVGPALMSGRITTIAVHPEDKQTWYVAVASGGVWKTTNAGTTWTPVFDNEGSLLDRLRHARSEEPDTVWVGTGENNSQRSVGYGDGVYHSDDGGKTWKNVGLEGLASTSAGS